MTTSRRLFASLALLATGCGHAPCVPCPAPVSCAPAPPPPAPALPESRPPPASLRTLSWGLRLGDSEPSVSLGPALHDFGYGAWQCALSGEKSEDAPVGAASSRLARTRRLACTHGSGLTVRSELTCALDNPATDDAADASQRELTLTLGGAGRLQLTCAAVRSRDSLPSAADSAQSGDSTK